MTIKVLNIGSCCFSRPANPGLPIRKRVSSTETHRKFRLAGLISFNYMNFHNNVTMQATYENSMKSNASSIAGWIILALMLCQFVPLNRTRNLTPAGSGIRASGVREILETRCGECHSDRTRWPGSAYIAPLSWYVVHEVQQSRKVLNFSDFRNGDSIGEIMAKNRIRKLINSGNTARHANIPGFAEPVLTPPERELVLGWTAAPDKKPAPDVKNSGRKPKVTTSKFKN
jgi:hypothetical protein